MGRILILIGTGGCLGSIARYLTFSAFPKLLPGNFPYGTFTANIVGCLLIGIIYGFAEKFHWLTPEWRFFLATGFCGGYTTFSAFALENIQLLQQSNYMLFAWYSISSFALGLLAVLCGLALAKF